MEQLDPKLKDLAAESAAEHAKQCSDGETLPESRDEIPVGWEEAERDFLAQKFNQRIPYKLLDRYMDFLVAEFEKENEEITRPGSPRHD
jgi:hypothetical protein